MADLRRIVKSQDLTIRLLIPIIDEELGLVRGMWELILLVQKKQVSRNQSSVVNIANSLQVGSTDDSIENVCKLR